MSGVFVLTIMNFLLGYIAVHIMENVSAMPFAAWLFEGPVWTGLIFKAVFVSAILFLMNHVKKNNRIAYIRLLALFYTVLTLSIFSHMRWITQL